MISDKQMLEMIKAQSGDRWPRGLGNPFRNFIAQNATDVLTYIKENNCKTVYFSVYSFTEYTNPKTDAKNAIIDCIPLDFDCATDPGLALDDMRFVLAWCKRHEIIPRISFSGSKGFHLIIDFNDISLNYPKETIKKFCQNIIDGGNLQCVDKSVLGDRNRLIRILNTKHKNTDLFCIPLTIEEAESLTITEIQKLALEQRYLIQERVPAPKIVDIVLHELDAEISKYKDVFQLKQSVLHNIFTTPKNLTCPAFDNIMNREIHTGFRDVALVGCIRYLVKTGKTKWEIYKVIKELNTHLNPRLSEGDLRYKLGYHLETNYSHCLFFTQFCPECKTCARSRWYL